MANVGSNLTGHNDDYPHTPNDREELHAYVRDRSSTWILWAVVAFLVVVGFYFWWGFYSARHGSPPPPPPREAPGIIAPSR